MNYLTNYYKNLSEKLQEKVNLLESYLSQVNEDLSAGTISQGYGSSTTSSTNQNQNNDQGLNALLGAWGPVNSNSGNAQYDLNGDGFVDGDDLGQFLANMSNSGGPVVMASTSAATPGTQSMGGKTPRVSGKASAAQTANISSNYGSGIDTNRPTNGNDSEMQGLLAAWGSNDPRYDYNRDGVVDGDDLGLVLARMVSAQNNSQNNPQLAEPTMSGGKVGNGSNRNAVTAIDQPGVAGNFGQGGPGSFGNGGSPRPPAPKPGPRGRNPTVTGVGNYTSSGNPVTPGGGSPRPPAPKPGPGGRPMQPTFGGFDTVQPTPNPFDVNSEFGNFGNPIVPPKQTRKTGPNFGTQSEIGSGFDVGSGIPSSQGQENGMNQQGIPYWMSQRTTQTDAGFRAMQRKRKD